MAAWRNMIHLYRPLLSGDPAQLATKPCSFENLISVGARDRPKSRPPMVIEAITTALPV
jgi:hypothetical protein